MASSLKPPNVSNIVNETPNGPRFPPQLLTPSLNLISLPPSLSPNDQIVFLKSLHNNNLLDLSSFQHDYVSLLTKISSDLATLVQAPFSLFWTYIVHDKSVLPAIQQTLTNLPSYYPFSPKFTSEFNALRHQHLHPSANLSNSWITTHKQGLSALFDQYDPLNIDKTTTLLNYFKWCNQMDNTIASEEQSNATPEDNDALGASFHELVLQTFATPRILDMLQNIYSRTILIVLRLSSHQQQFLDLDNLTLCSSQNSSKSKLATTYDTTQLSSVNLFLSPNGPFASLFSNKSPTAPSPTTTAQSNINFHPRYTNSANKANAHKIQQFQHLSILTTLNIFSPQFFIDFIQTYGIYEPKLVQLVILRVVKYHPIVHEFKKAIEMLYFFYFTLEKQFTSTYLTTYYSSYLSAQLIRDNITHVLEEAEYSEIRFFLQNMQNFITIMLSIYTIDPTIMNTIISTIVPTTQSNLIDAMGEIQHHEMDNPANLHSPFSDTPDTSNPFLSLLADTKPLKKSKDLGNAVQNRECIVQYPTLLQFLIRLFDYTIPTIAQLLHMDLGMTLLGTDGVSAFTSSPSTNTITTSSTSLPNNSAGLTTLSQQSYLRHTMLADFDSQFSYSNYRYSGVFYHLCFDIIYLTAILFNASILAPIGLEFTPDYIIKHLCQFHELPTILQDKTVKQQPVKTDNKNDKTKDTTTVEEYSPPGFTLTQQQDDALSEENLATFPDVFKSTPSIQKLNTNLSIYNFLYSLVSFFSPQPNPLDHVAKYDDATIASQLTPETILTPYQSGVVNEFAFSGSLFYFLPISPLFVLLKKVDKVHAANSSGKRTVLPDHIPISTFEVLQQLQQLLLFYAPAKKRQDDKDPRSQPQVKLPSQHLHYNAVGLKQNLTYFQSITSISNLVQFISSRINLFESSCYPIATAQQFNNEEYTTYLYASFTAPLFSDITAALDVLPEPVPSKLPSGLPKHWRGVLDEDTKKNAQDTKGKKGHKIEIDTTLSEQDQFKQYLAQTGRVQGSTANPPKSKHKVGISGPTVLAPLSEQERLAVLQRYTASIQRYDDDYDDDIDSFTGFYGMKSFENSNGQEDEEQADSPAANQPPQSQSRTGKPGPQAQKGGHGSHQKNQEKSQPFVPSKDRASGAAPPTGPKHHNQSESKQGSGKGDFHPSSKAPLPGSDADFKAQGVNSTLTAKHLNLQTNQASQKSAPNTGHKKHDSGSKPTSGSGAKSTSDAPQQSGRKNATMGSDGKMHYVDRKGNDHIRHESKPKSKDNYKSKFAE